MNYTATLSYLDEIQGKGIKLGLDNISELLHGWGDPHRAFPAAVVGGTNGKGSVSAMLASILKHSGLRVGLYTSPHLVRYEERIALDGRPISSDEFAEAISRTRERIDLMLAEGGLASHPTHFEILTAAAFDLFRRRDVEVAVLEVGMGGRLDAVAVARTAVAVICNVSREHTMFLGDTLTAIATEKAGIIAPGCRVVTGERGAEALEVIRRTAAERVAELIESRAARVVPSKGSDGRFDLVTPDRAYRDLEIPLGGSYQIGNAALAVLAAEAMSRAVPGTVTGLTEATVARGLASSRWPGRFQVIGRAPLLVLDGAHNPAAGMVLAEALDDLRRRGEYERLCIVIGILEGKEMGPVIESLSALADRVIATRGRSDRFRRPEEIASAARSMGRDARVIPDLAGAIAAARRWASPTDAICVCGSLYLVGDSFEVLGVEPFSDSSSER